MLSLVKLSLVLFFVCKLINVSQGEGSLDATLQAEFDQSLLLYNGSDGRYELYWSVDSDDNATFAVRVQTTGWVAFGISPNGLMPGSDIAFAWVDGGSGEVSFSVSCRISSHLVMYHLLSVLYGCLHKNIRYVTFPRIDIPLLV